MPVDTVTGLPVDRNGNLDPTGNIYEIPSGKMNASGDGVTPYGAQGAFNQRQKSLNPLDSVIARTIRKNAKDRLNEYLRSRGQTPLGPEDEVPSLLILAELRKFTQDPLRTDARKILRNFQIEMSTSQEIQVKWGRTPYKSVPYEVRQFPLHVADLILHQIDHFVSVPVKAKDQRFYIGVAIPKGSIQASHKPFRKATTDEKLPDRFKKMQAGASVAVLTGHGSTGALYINLDPMGEGNNIIDVTNGLKKEVERDGQTREEFVVPPNSPRVSVGAPPVGSTSYLPEKPAEEGTNQPTVGLPAPAQEVGAR